MRQLVAEIDAALEEYRQKAPTVADALHLERLPQEGFSITRSNSPRITLECRPDYAGQVVYCNLGRTDKDAGEVAVREVAFNLHFELNDADAVVLRREPRVFRNASDAAEFLLEPVLFPQPDHLL
jgi:hypothetical protein